MTLMLRELFVFAALLLFHGAAMELHGAAPDWLASHLLRDVGSGSDQAVYRTCPWQAACFTCARK